MELKLDLENPEESIKLIQESFDEIVKVNQEYKEELLKKNKIMEEAETVIADLQNSAIDLSDTIKAINMTLINKKNLFKGDEIMEDLLTTISKFMLSSSAIKLGVMSEARRRKLEEETE